MTDAKESKAKRKRNMLPIIVANSRGRKRFDARCMFALDPATYGNDAKQDG